MIRTEVHCTYFWHLCSIHNNQKCIAKISVDLYSCSVTDLKTITLIKLERETNVCEFKLSWEGVSTSFFFSPWIQVLSWPVSTYPSCKCGKYDKQNKSWSFHRAWLEIKWESSQCGTDMYQNWDQSWETSTLVTEWLKEALNNRQGTS